MLRIVEHIEKLLRTHDCVTIPHFGGFVLQWFPSSVEGDLFHPMHRSILFNATLQHTDGLIQESYMKAYGVEYHEAELMVEEDADTLRSQLEKSRTVPFGEIGLFKLGKEDQIIFQPCINESFDAASYGLTDFHFPLLPVLEQREVEKKILDVKRGVRHDVYYIPVSRKLLHVAASIAAAVALFFLISTPVKDVNPSAYTASFVPSALVSEEISQPSDSVQPTDSTAVALESTEDQNSVNAETTVAAPQTTTQSVATPALQPESPKPEASVRTKWFHAVIGSFPSESAAKSYLSHINHSKYPHANIINRDGKYRIYADRFDNRTAAESYIENLRSSSNYQDAWLFISR
jgi:hypothetical protein